MTGNGYPRLRCRRRELFAWASKTPNRFLQIPTQNLSLSYHHDGSFTELKRAPHSRVLIYTQSCVVSRVTEQGKKMEAVADSPAAPTLTPWIPEDDLLLKNAVEAGASLEALAKGAVPFSRRYTLKELRDRWHSMLYDTDVATQASACILELEGAACNIPTKAIASCGVKPRKMEHGKRKAETIRTQYYRMQKRRRTEFFSSFDLDFLAEPIGPQFGNTFHQPIPDIDGTCDVNYTGDAFHSEGPQSFPIEDDDDGNFDGFASFLCESLLSCSNEEEEEVRIPMTSSTCEKINELSTSGSGSKPQEINYGPIYCVLNTEDPEIPCNDGIFLDKWYPPKAAKKGEEDPENPKPSLPLARRRTKKAIGDSSRRKSAKNTSNRIKDKKDGARPAETGVVNKRHKLDKSPFPAEVGGAAETSLPESIKLSSDQEEPESENVVPFFSDVEAMILEKDLDMQDHDLYFSRHVLKYQNDDSKRKIIKLEQSAQSAQHRTMTCHGALAILYGRRLKHFIRKTEVILGRSTVEFDVDIDLGKEGCANRISRRQAFIKLEEDGIFYLTNLGKAPIYVNSKEVTVRQSLGLSPSCVIEIRGISLVFETNPKAVQLYLDNIVKNTEHVTHEQPPAEKP